MRVYLPTQGTQSPSVVCEDPTCRGQPSPVPLHCWVREPQLPRPVQPTARARRGEQPAHRRGRPCSLRLGEGHAVQGRPGAAEKQQIDGNAAPRCLAALPPADCPCGESGVLCKDSQGPPACPSSDTAGDSSHLPRVARERPGWPCTRCPWPDRQVGCALCSSASWRALHPVFRLRKVLCKIRSAVCVRHARVSHRI